MAIKYCMFCGAQLPSTALFCPTCGNKQSLDEVSIKVDQSVLEKTSQENEDDEESSAEYGLLSAWGYTKPQTQQSKSTISNVINNTKQSQSKQTASLEQSKKTNINEQPKEDAPPKKKGPKLGGRFEIESEGIQEISFEDNTSTEAPVSADAILSENHEVQNIVAETIEIVDDEIVSESYDNDDIVEEDEDDFDGGIFDDEDDDDDDDDENINNYILNMAKGINQPIPESLQSSNKNTSNVPETEELLDDEDGSDNEELIKPEQTISSENSDRKFTPTGKTNSSYKKRNLSEEDESIDEGFTSDSVKITSGIAINPDDDSDMLADEKEDLRKYKEMKAQEKKEQEALKKSQEIAAEGRTKTKRQKETRKNIDFIISQRKVNEIQHEEVNTKGLDPDYDGYYETVKPIDFDKQKDNSAIIKTVVTGVLGFALVSAIFYVLFSFFTL